MTTHDCLLFIYCFYPEQVKEAQLYHKEMLSNIWHTSFINIFNTLILLYYSFMTIFGYILTVSQNHFKRWFPDKRDLNVLDQVILGEQLR